VRAAIAFVESGGTEAIITQLRCALPAIEGKTGTHVVGGTGSLA
jgi:carbamate kinase